MSKKADTIAEAGEFGLIEIITRLLAGNKPPELTVDIGDDTAALRFDTPFTQLLTCDMQVENQHFRLAWIDPLTLGRRAIAVNLSDIAAMGGNPTYALVSLGLPAHLELSFFESLIKGLRAEMDAHQAYIIGGNLSGGTDRLIIDITMIGQTDLPPVTRFGAQPGDLVYVTGTVGASSIGYRTLKHFGTSFPEELRPAVNKYLKPEARVAVGRGLAESGLVTAMIDLSDGLRGDLGQICRLNQVGTQIETDLLPIPKYLDNFPPEAGDLDTLILTGGDDYELLFTVRSDNAEPKLAEISAKTGVNITRIGNITSNSGELLIKQKTGEIRSDFSGSWDHFK